MRGRFGGCAVCSTLGPDAESLASFSRSATVRFLLLSRSSSLCEGSGRYESRERVLSLSPMRERRLPPPEVLGSGCNCWGALALELPAKCGATSRCAFQSRSRVDAESVLGPREVSLDDIARGAEGGNPFDEEGPSGTRFSPDLSDPRPSLSDALRSTRRLSDSRGRSWVSFSVGLRPRSSR